MTSDGSGRVNSSETSAHAPKLITRDADDKAAGMYASLSGTLSVGSDNCVQMTIRDGQRHVGIIWGHGWSAQWEGGKAVIYDPKGTRFAQQGDSVRLAGGGVAPDGEGARYREHPCWSDDMFEANDSQGSQHLGKPSTPQDAAVHKPGSANG